MKKKNKGFGITELIIALMVIALIVIILIGIAGKAESTSGKENKEYDKYQLIINDEVTTFEAACRYQGWSKGGASVGYTTSEEYNFDLAVNCGTLYIIRHQGWNDEKVEVVNGNFEIRLIEE